MAIEKDELRELKQRASTQLMELEWQALSERLSVVDDRLIAYIREVATRPERHNLYEQLSVLRFVGMLERYDLRADAVRRFVVVYEYLHFPTDIGMRRFKLTPIQVFQFTSILGFYYRDTNRRVVTEALLFVPRKYSKSTSVSSLAIYDLLYGDANAQCFVAANSYDQAQICFSVIKSILKALDPKLKHFKINRQQIYNLQCNKTSFARCLASNPKKLDGLNASLVILDEYAQADSDALKNVLTSSMGARLNPLTVVITTTSNKLDTPFTEELEAYKAILRGELCNDSMFAHIFEPDVDDAEGDTNTWYKVQPHLGITCREEFYQDKWAKAQMSSGNMEEFRTKLLNVFAVSSERVWIERQRIEGAFYQHTLDELHGYRAVVAVDLSVSDDFSAVTYLVYTPDRVLPGRTKPTPFHSITEYYFPEGQLATHPNSELYSRWVEAGYLNLCKGDTIDYEAIAQSILSKPLRTLGIGYDPYKSKQFVQMLEYHPNVGREYLYKIPQTYGSFTSPVETFEMTLYTESISFDPNPITAYCFANAHIDEDRQENRKPIKSVASNKIDGAITNVMCFWLLANVNVSA